MVNIPNPAILLTILSISSGDTSPDCEMVYNIGNSGIMKV